MIKEMKLQNIEIEDGEKNMIAQNIQGKILKVLFNPTNVNSGVRLRIFTREGEMILDITQEGLYYPRANVSSEKVVVDTFSPVGDDKDYYYFNKELLFNITTETDFEGIVIDELTLIYEETTKDTQTQMFPLIMILQELIRQNQQRDLDASRG